MSATNINFPMDSIAQGDCHSPVAIACLCAANNGVIKGLGSIGDDELPVVRGYRVKLGESAWVIPGGDQVSIDWRRAELFTLKDALRVGFDFVELYGERISLVPEFSGEVEVMSTEKGGSEDAG